MGPDGRDTCTMPRRASRQPRSGTATLFTSIVAELAERDGLLRIKGDAGGLAYYATPQGCLHKWDMHMLWGDVQHEAGLQLDAWLRKNARV